VSIRKKWTFVREHEPLICEDMPEEIAIVDDHRKTIAIVYGQDYRGYLEGIDIARLIAAAPDLLAACKEAELLMHAGISLGMEGPERDAIDSENAQQCGDILQRIKAAIAKAGQPARKEQDR
jgi:hypothetical protein